jgi:hypothetical protein
MRLYLTLLASCFALSAYAAEPPPGSAQLPPPALNAVPDEEPQVTIIKKADQTVEEYRINGRLYMIKIIPKKGVPYYLVDDQGDGKFSRQEGLDTGLRPPRWVIHTF